MITTKTLAKELGFSQNVIRRAKEFLGITGERTILPGGGFVYALSEEDANRIKFRQDSIETGRGRSYKPCRVCGESGHTSLRCPENPEPVECTTCHQTKYRSDFQAIKRTLPNGKKTAFLMNECKKCSNKRSREKYTGTFRGRLTALRCSIVSRSPESTLTIAELMGKYESQDGRCFYSGLELSLDTGHYAISVDQVIPDGGYTKENTVLTCWIVNQMKRNLSVDRFLEICRMITEKHS